MWAEDKVMVLLNVSASPRNTVPAPGEGQLAVTEMALADRFQHVSGLHLLPLLSREHRAVSISQGEGLAIKELDT